MAESLDQYLDLTNIGYDVVLVDDTLCTESEQENGLQTVVCLPQTGNKTVPSGKGKKKVAATTNPDNKKKKHHFYVGADIVLLKAAIQFNPWENGPDAWKDVIKTLMDKLDFVANIRQVIDRIKFLIRKFQDECLADINKTGTETQWDERATLCEEVCDLMEAAKILKISDSDKPDKLSWTMPGLGPSERKAANQERDVAADKTLKDVTSETTSQSDSDHILDAHIKKRKKLKGSGIMDIMEEKIDREAKARQTELEMKREKMEFEFEMRRRQMDLEERRIILQEKQQLQDAERKRERHEDHRLQQEFFMRVLDIATKRN